MVSNFPTDYGKNWLHSDLIMLMGLLEPAEKKLGDVTFKWGELDCANRMMLISQLIN